MTQSNFVSRVGGAQAQFADVLRWICMLVLAFTLTACVDNEESVGAGNPVPPPGGGTPPPPPPPPPAPPNDQAIFEATLYPLLVDSANFCVGCHGVAQEPMFAVSDATTAYNAITSQQKVNLSDPANSRVYLRPAVDRHNCGGDTVCDRIAADFLVAIQDWADQAGAIAPPPSAGAVKSAATDFAGATGAGTARVDANVIAMFTFSEGAGDVTMDSSGVGTPIALQLTGTEWVEGGGLRNISGKAQASAADSQKLFNMITPNDAYTVEAWVIPDNTAQDGPARIVSYSQDTAVRNFTLGQNAIYYQLRNRSAATDANGQPALEALSPEVNTGLQHVVATFDSQSGRKVYVDGQLGIEENTADTLDWVTDQLLVLGNEVTDNRLWQGVLRLVAIHNTALTAAEVQQNFQAGVGNTVTLRFDVSSVVGGTSSIDMLAAQLDPVAYLFAQPVFVSDVTGVRVKNIRIAVNGFIPVAAQTFRRIDTTVMQTGTELSPLGAVIPLDQGPMVDQFHLEFEILGDQFGEAEPPVPSQPPLPLPDEVEPDLGLRTFSQVNDTMGSLTGIDPNQNAVSTRYAQLRDSLPPTSNILAFSSAHQIAIQQLATTYCGEIVNNAGTCTGLFGACEVAGNGKAQVADALYDAFIGDNIANQPDRADVTTEVVSTIDDLNCANGCNGAEGETVLQATCTAVLSSAAVSVN